MILPWLENYNLLNYNKIDSTNNEALRLVKSGAKGNFVIVARMQTNGRGTKGKPWKSIVGNLHMSILLELKAKISRITELSFLTAIALHETVQDSIDKLKAPKADLKLKWPNDVLINGKKLAGILIESICLNNANYVIIGIGVNTHFIPNISAMATTSLFNEGVILKNSDYFLSDFMDKFQKHYYKWQKEDNFDQIRLQWLALAYKLNNIVTLDNGIQKASGIFRGINHQGNISIELANGELCSFSSGQVAYT